MSHKGGTYTAVRSRQWVGGRLVLNSAGLMLAAAAAAAGTLVGWTLSQAPSETFLFLTSWSYSSVQMVYTYPPILLWVGMLITLMSGPGLVPVLAINVAQGHGRFGVRSNPQVQEAARNLTRQLHARGRAGLFRRNVYVRLGFGFVGSVLVLVTAMLAPTSITTSGQAIPDVETGLLPMVCLVGSLIALVGLLLAVPFGRCEYVVIDVWGNVRGADGPVVVPPSVPPLGSEEPGVPPSVPPRELRP